MAALLAMERLPVTLPADFGAKVTLKLVFCPAVKVKGRAGPLTLKPAPVAAATEMVTLVLPVFVTTTGKTLLLLRVTLPKLRLVGLAESAWRVPVPESVTVKGELEASLASEMLPEALPAAVGENVALKLALCPAARVKGRGSPLILNPVPLSTI